MQPFTSCFFLVTLACLTAFTMGQQDVAVRVLINQGQPVLDAVCSEAEYSAIAAAFNNAVATANMRRLRTARKLDPYWCANYCRGFAHGTCYLAYSQCTSYRMLVEGITVDQEAELIEAGARDLNKADATLLSQCDKAEKEIFKAVKHELDWGSLAPSCKNLLKTNVSTDCFLPPV
jgi:hypothetical protein